MPATTKIDRFIFIAVLSTSIHNMINNKAENIIGLGISTIVFLLAFSVILSQQIVSAQQKQASSSDNVTAQVAPQGTSLNASKGTTATPNNTPNSSSGNVTASVKPQGTSLQKYKSDFCNWSRSKYYWPQVVFSTVIDLKARV